MELTKFDGFAICSDIVTGSHGDFMITVLLGHDPDVTPNCFVNRPGFTGDSIS